MGTAKGFGSFHFTQFPASRQIRCVNEMEAKAFSREGHWCVHMETLQAYLDRKHEEVSLLNNCLRRPLALPPANSAPAVVKQKFQLAAALKAQHALDSWASTETAWAEQKDFCSGPFRFRYGRHDRIGDHLRAGATRSELGIQGKRAGHSVAQPHQA
jgi:hypothetical protein